MRVTESMFPTTLISQLSKLTERQNQLQNQAATGQRVRRPEDDSQAFRRTLELQADSSNTEQYRRNIARLQETATVSYDAIKSLKAISDRASEIALMADGMELPEDLRAYATEIDQLIGQGLQLANSSHLGVQIFAGTKSDDKPFVAVTDASGKITSVNYVGNESVPENEVADGFTLGVFVPGANTSGSGPEGLLTDSRSGADFFAHLISVRDHLEAGDTESVANTDRAALQLDADNLLMHVGNNGVVQARLETAAAIAAKRTESLNTFISREVDADLAETLTRLTETQTAYRVALQSGASIMDQSLMDFLR